MSEGVEGAQKMEPKERKQASCGVGKGNDGGVINMSGSGDMNTDVTGLGTAEAATAAIEPIYMHLSLTDPDVVAAVSAYPVGPQRKEFVDLCLKVGVMAVRAAKGEVDGEAIKRSGEALLLQIAERLESFRESMGGQVAGVLGQYFDPTSGAFSTRVRALVEDNGELERVVRQPLQQEGERLKATIEGLIGPDGRLTRLLGTGEDNQFIRALREQVEGVLAAQQQRVNEQFSLDDESSALSRLVRELKAGHGDLSEALSKRVGEVTAEFSLDRQDSALSRLVAAITQSQEAISSEFSLDKPGSALSRLQQEVLTRLTEGQTRQQEFQTQVFGMLAEMRGKKEAEKASTTHGAEFEARVGAKLKEFADAAGDVLEDCGTTTGLIRASKVGDFTLTLSPDSAAAGAKIVIEAKESKSYTLKMTIDECDEAKRNRGADVAVFVHSKATADSKMDVLRRHGNDIIVVWDAEDERTDVALRAAMELAKGLSLRKATNSGEEKASYDLIDKAIETMRKQLEGFEELRTLAQTQESGATKMQNRVRIMSETAGKALEVIVAQLAKVRHDKVDGLF